MAIYVKRKDGVCKECGGVLEVVGADDVSLDVECTRCGEFMHVEVDAFGDGGVDYWPRAMAEFENGI